MNASGLIPDIILRLATIEDAQMLLTWRNDAVAQEASHHSHIISMQEHMRWLQATLSNPHIKLYIGEQRGMPVGTARADYRDDAWMLSWTVAPESRREGIGKRLVQMLMQHLSGAVRAEIKAGNIASIRIAEYAGMVREHEQNGILYYQRPAKAHA